MANFLKYLSPIAMMQGNQPDPFKKAAPFYENTANVTKPYYDPYINQGRGASELTNDIYQRFAEDPTGVFNELRGQYQESPYLPAKRERLDKFMRSSGATTGTLGTSEDERRRASMLSELEGEEFQNWLTNILGIQGTGLQGQENIANRGYNASMGYGDILGNIEQQKGDLAYQSQAQKNAQKNAMLQAVLQLAGQLGGGAIGGPAGAAAGGALGSAIGGGSNGGFNFSPSARNSRDYSGFQR